MPTWLAVAAALSLSAAFVLPALLVLRATGRAQFGTGPLPARLLLILAGVAFVLCLWWTFV